MMLADLFRAGYFHRVTVDFYSHRRHCRLALASFTGCHDGEVMIDERFERSALLEFRKGWIRGDRWQYAVKPVPFCPTSPSVGVQILHDEQQPDGFRFVGFTATDGKGNPSLVILYARGYVPNNEDERLIIWPGGFTPLLGGNKVRPPTR